MRLQSAIFDMDGTLLDSMGMWRTLGSVLAKNHGAEAPADLDRQVASLGLWEGTAYCKEVCGLPGTVDELVSEVWGQIEDFYQNHVEPKPGVVKFLSLLKMEGVWMYVATATDRPLVEAALRHAGIDGYFRGIITSREAGQTKREGPEIYERAMRRLRSNKKDTVVFEDALHAVQTAKAAGFRVAAVYDPSEPEQEELRRLADYYITSYEEMFETTDFF
ncbi:HAD family phosphatase [uncultured Oscillibacter sp.]|uniref:HAD family hydrolase n=1 Tax=uncultured Oscillibacter sp. TaxID=876091 RepID=UPI0025F78484|nr:HAD family phosphatase [uncultured Oscillibacter sp.]